MTGFSTIDVLVEKSFMSGMDYFICLSFSSTWLILVQGVQKWNVPFENASVAKLLNNLTGTDAF